MPEFIDFEVSIEDTNQNLEEEENNEVSDNNSLKSLISNEKIKSDKTFYHKFENVTASIDDVLKQEYDKSMGDIEKVDFSDFCKISEEENHLDEFKDSEKRINRKIDTVLDYQKCNSQCHEINLILAKYGYYLRVFELKVKFHHITLKNPKKQNVRQLSSCINEK